MMRLENVSVSYASARRAVSDVSLTFEPGQFTVLLGPSGAGKSTLLRTLNGLVRPECGVVSANGVGAILAGRERLRAHRRRTGMVFQQHHLVGCLTAHANVMTGRLGHLGRKYAFLPLPVPDRVLALAALDRVGLIDKAFVRADKLSGGEQQRVGVARALVQKPELILADEPVASLDPASAVAILSLLKTIAEEDGFTTIVSLHQVDLARRFADRIVGLNQGRVVFSGTPAGLDDAALAKIYAMSRAEH